MGYINLLMLMAVGAKLLIWESSLHMTFLETKKCKELICQKKNCENMV